MFLTTWVPLSAEQNHHGLYVQPLSLDTGLDKVYCIPFLGWMSHSGFSQNSTGPHMATLQVSLAHLRLQTHCSRGFQWPSEWILFVVTLLVYPAEEMLSSYTSSCLEGLFWHYIPYFSITMHKANSSLFSFQNCLTKPYMRTWSLFSRSRYGPAGLNGLVYFSEGDFIPSRAGKGAK